MFGMKLNLILCVNEDYFFIALKMVQQRSIGDDPGAFSTSLFIHRAISTVLAQQSEQQTVHQTGILICCGLWKANQIVMTFMSFQEGDPQFLTR